MKINGCHRRDRTRSRWRDAVSCPGALMWNQLLAIPCFWLLDQDMRPTNDATCG